MEFKQVTTKDGDFRDLVEQLDKELWERYPETQGNFVEINRKIEDAKAVVGYVGSRPMCCGCLKISGSVGEVKRMYVHRDHRGRGYSKVLIQHLEDIARSHQVTRMVLETQMRQPEAIASYKSSGFGEIEKFGPYVGNVLSVCMGKDL